MPLSRAVPPVASGSSPRRHRHRVVASISLLALVVSSVWVGRLAAEHAGVGRARAYWSVPHGATGGLMYVASGDSAAQGVGASRPQRGYVGLLARDRSGARQPGPAT